MSSKVRWILYPLHVTDSWTSVLCERCKFNKQFSCLLHRISRAAGSVLQNELCVVVVFFLFSAPPHSGCQISLHALGYLLDYCVGWIFTTLSTNSVSFSLGGAVKIRHPHNSSVTVCEENAAHPLMDRQRAAQAKPLTSLKSERCSPPKYFLKISQVRQEVLLKEVFLQQDVDFLNYYQQELKDCRQLRYFKAPLFSLCTKEKYSFFNITHVLLNFNLIKRRGFSLVWR